MENEFDKLLTCSSLLNNTFADKATTEYKVHDVPSVCSGERVSLPLICGLIRSFNYREREEQIN